MLPSDFRNWLSSPQRRPLVVGIINTTPDSFSDGGRYLEPAQASDRAEELVAAGADWLDIGGESSRPGAEPVPVEEQMRRVLPAIAAIRRRLGILISIDTTQVEVAERAADSGADVVNDISAGRDDPQMFPMLARRGLPVVLMHMQGTPRTMQVAPDYRDVTAEVSQFLLDRRDRAVEAGIDPKMILLDPGIGFGKTQEHDLKIIRDIRHFAGLGHPLFLGPSRKRFIGQITGEKEPDQRVIGTAAVVAWCVANGAAALRVHDVGPICQTVRVIEAIMRNADNPLPAPTQVVGRGVQS